MNYTVTLHNVWCCDDDGKSTTLKDDAYISVEDRTYAAMNEGQFAKILKEELDIADYPLTPKNIKKEFGFEESGNAISDECIDRIIKYYKFRKDLYSKIAKQFTCSAAEALLKKLGADIVTVKYYIPYYGNSFSCEDPEYDGGHVEAWIEVEASK